MSVGELGFEFRNPEGDHGCYAAKTDYAENVLYANRRQNSMLVGFCTFVSVFARGTKE